MLVHLRRRATKPGPATPWRPLGCGGALPSSSLRRLAYATACVGDAALRIRQRGARNASQQSLSTGCSRPYLTRSVDDAAHVEM